PDLAMWTDLPLGSLLQYVDAAPMDSSVHDRNHDELIQEVTRYGISLGNDDRATLRRFHDEFATSGLDIQYTSRAGWSRRPFPTARQLYLETDLEGVESSYLAT